MPFGQHNVTIHFPVITDDGGHFTKKINNYMYYYGNKSKWNYGALRKNEITLPSSSLSKTLAVLLDGARENPSLEGLVVSGLD